MVRVKDNTNSWLDGEVITLINKRDDYYIKISSKVRNKMKIISDIQNQI